MKFQRGGFVIGFVIGLLVGLALALGVALYVSKVPPPFINKVAGRNAQQDAEQEEKNKNWDPNKPLYGKNPAVPHAVEAPASDAGSAPLAASDADSASAASVAPIFAPASAPTSRARALAAEKEARAIMQGGADDAGSAPPAHTRASPADTPASASQTSGNMIYYVQAGAFGASEDAEAQRAKLAILGMEPRVSQRDQNGHPVFRVRIGPYTDQSTAEEVKARLASEGVDAALVRIAH